MRNPKLKVVSLFTGAGGLDLGFEAAGFETCAAVEMDRAAVVTLRHNRAWPIIDRDVHTVSGQELRDAGSVADGDRIALIGGPPCQPFSKSGYWARGDSRRLQDPRASTLSAYLRLVEELLPEVFVIENVAGLRYRNKDEGFRFIESAIGRINRRHGTKYSFSWAVLNAADFGVPQERERCFIVGQRSGVKFEFPAPTCAPAAMENGVLPFRNAEPRRTAWDAIGDLEHESHPALRVGGRWAELLPSIPEGQNYQFHTDRGSGLPLFGWRRRYWSFLLKLARDRPAWTLTAQPGSAIGPFHWRNRRLSMRELCRLQTFPDAYEIVGSQAAIQRQAGNAVPAALAEVLARAIRTQLLGAPVASRAKLIPMPRACPKYEETIAAVPRKYLHLIGEHAAHPGTGQGYAAAARSATSRKTRRSVRSGT